jgi:hypothetical protein
VQRALIFGKTAPVEGRGVDLQHRASRAPSVAREYEPVVGQWYENVDDNESFRVLSVDEDAELVEIEYLDGDIEEMDLETWQELDLEMTDTPEGWSGEEVGEDEDEDDDWDEDEDEDEDNDEDDDDWDDEVDDQNY